MPLKIERTLGGDFTILRATSDGSVMGHFHVLATEVEDLVDALLHAKWVREQGWRQAHRGTKE